MHNFLVGFIDTLTSRLVTSQHDLSAQLKNRATIDTANYVEDRMSNAIILESTNELYEYSVKKASNQGLFMEFGVWHGDSINTIAGLKPDNVIYGFDSFEGLPDKWSGTFHHEFSLTLDGNMPKVKNNVKLIKGWFDESLPNFLESNTDSVSFLHVDSDLYSSAKTILTLLKNRIKVGTVIIFNEYFNYPNWRNHEYKAFQEFVKENNVKYDYICFSKKKMVTVIIRHIEQ